MEAILSTEENLKTAIAGEHYEAVSMYPPFLQDALAEGNKKAATSFEYAWKVEQVHEALYSEALQTLKQPEDEAIDYYVCPVCGYTHPRNAPDRCPVCNTPGSRFEKIS